MRGPALTGEFQFGGKPVHCDNGKRSREPRSENRTEPDAAEPEDRERSSGCNLGRVDDGSHAGHDGAPKQHGDFQWNVIVNFDEGFPCGHGELGKAGHAEVMK